MESWTGSPRPTHTSSSPVSILGARRRLPLTRSTLTVARPAISMATNEHSPRLMTACRSPMARPAPATSTGRYTVLPGFGAPDADRTGDGVDRRRDLRQVAQLLHLGVCRVVRLERHALPVPGSTVSTGSCAA